LTWYNPITYAAFTLSGFDDQERNLTFVKTYIKVLKLKFHSCNFKQAFYPLHKLYHVSLTTRKYFYTIFRSVPGCQTATLGNRLCINATLGNRLYRLTQRFDSKILMVNRDLFLNFVLITN